jgi:hypothetical protein
MWEPDSVEEDNLPRLNACSGGFTKRREGEREEGKEGMEEERKGGRDLICH